MNTPSWIQWPSLITWLTLILLGAVAFNVARARARYDIRAPATSGHEHFERIFRVQMNTLENTVVFLPALWLAAWYWNPAWASACGAVWLLGRIWYAHGYGRAAARRGGGYYLSSAGLMALVVGSAVGWVRALAWT
ncbi:MAG TPA: MAPEG family protein [Burkholderiaceae bacterium]|nr:MAPEG family protein [Burkholderiaceae bacterium]